MAQRMHKHDTRMQKIKTRKLHKTHTIIKQKVYKHYTIIPEQIHQTYTNMIQIYLKIQEVQQYDTKLK